MKSCLIGYTGFVGGNLDSQYKFDYKYNSKNINDIIGKEFDLVVCAGVRAQKWLANTYPNQDINEIKNLTEKIKTIKTKKFVLISTIDVYKNPIDVNENKGIDLENLHPYGKNRIDLENWIIENFEESLIVRLPALFGQGLKKNFIYDLITVIPSTIMKEKFESILSEVNEQEKNILKESYTKDLNGNFNLNNDITIDIKNILKDILTSVDFTSKVFTDERSEFPFYYLDNIWNDIKVGIDNNIKILNLAVEPISAKEIAKMCFNTDFENIIEGKNPVKYDMKTIYCDKFNKQGDYLYTKQEVIEQIKDYLSKIEV